LFGSELLVHQIFPPHPNPSSKNLARTGNPKVLLNKYKKNKAKPEDGFQNLKVVFKPEDGFQNLKVVFKPEDGFQNQELNHTGTCSDLDSHSPANWVC
jgi:hypothetical protein